MWQLQLQQLAWPLGEQMLEDNVLKMSEQEDKENLSPQWAKKENNSPWMCSKEALQTSGELLNLLNIETILSWVFLLSKAECILTDIQTQKTTSWLNLESPK